MNWQPLRVHLSAIGCFLLAIHSNAANAFPQDAAAAFDADGASPITTTEKSELATFLATWQHVERSLPILPVFDHTIAVDRHRTALIGGFTKNLTSSPTIQIYVDGKGWQPIGSHLLDSRARHTQSMLPGGRVLIVGGVQGTIGQELTPLTSCEVINPFIAGSIVVEPLDEPLIGHSAHNLPDGRVAIVGGRAVHIFDGNSLQWVDRIELIQPRSGHAAVLLDDTTLLIMGGDENGTIEQVDLSTLNESTTIVDETIEAEASDAVLAIEESSIMPELVLDHVVLSLDEDEVSDATASPPGKQCEIVATQPSSVISDSFAARSFLWQDRLPRSLIESAAIVLDTRCVFLVGGFDQAAETTVDETWLLDPTTQQITPCQDLRLDGGVAKPGLTLDPQGRIAIVGGEWRADDRRGNANVARLYDINTQQLWALPPLPTDASRRIWMCDNNGRLVGHGGYRFVSRNDAKRRGVLPGLYLSTDQITLNLQPLPVMRD